MTNPEALPLVRDHATVVHAQAMRAIADKAFGGAYMDWYKETGEPTMAECVFCGEEGVSPYYDAEFPHAEHCPKAEYDALSSSKPTTENNDGQG